jgi:hypothetical protein
LITIPAARADSSAAALQAIKQFTQGSSGAAKQGSGGGDMVSKVRTASARLRMHRSFDEG